MVEGASVGAEDGMEDLRSFTVSDVERKMVADRRAGTLGRKNSLLVTGVFAAGIGGKKAGFAPCLVLFLLGH